MRCPPAVSSHFCVAAASPPEGTGTVSHAKPAARKRQIVLIINDNACQLGLGVWSKSELARQTCSERLGKVVLTHANTSTINFE